MSRRTTGTLLLGISGILYAARYIAAAIFGSGMTGWSSKNFQALLQYIGPDLANWSLVSLVVGTIYLICAELQDFVTKKTIKK